MCLDLEKKTNLIDLIFSFLQKPRNSDVACVYNYVSNKDKS